MTAGRSGTASAPSCNSSISTRSGIVEPEKLFQRLRNDFFAIWIPAELVLERRGELRQFQGVHVEILGEPGLGRDRRFGRSAPGQQSGDRAPDKALDVLEFLVQSRGGRRLHGRGLIAGAS